MILGASFMTAHWWLLGNLVRSLVEGRRFEVLLRGMLSVFPAGAALAVVFVAAGLDRPVPLQAAVGVVCIPAAVTLYCFFSGMKGQADV